MEDIEMSEHRDKDFQLPPNPFVARDGRQYRDCPAPDEEYFAAGFYSVIRAPKPEGDYREVRTLEPDHFWYVGWEAFDARAERLAALSPHFGRVDELVALLVGFGVSLPCERATAKEEVRASVAADPRRAGDAMKLMDILLGLDRDGITDGDILLIATRDQ